MYSFPNLEPVYYSMSGFNCCFLTCTQILQEAGKVSWYSHLLKNFPQFLWSTQRLWCSQWSESRCFSGILLLFLWSKGCWQFDFWFLCLFLNPVWTSWFTYCSLPRTWKFLVHILLKPGLENFEHYFTSMWNECNCAVVWTFFGVAFLWDWNENWPFPVL